VRQNLTAHHLNTEYERIGSKNPLVETFVLIVAVLLVGCATTSSRTTAINGGLIEGRNKGEEISEREQQCVRQAVNRTNDRIAQIDATPDALTASRIHSANDDRDREVLGCHGNVDHEKAQLSATERAEYENQAQREHDRAALMMILTTSLPR